MTEEPPPRGLRDTHFVAHEVAIVCTDRGQHSRMRLTTARWWQPNDGAEPDQVSMLEMGRKFYQASGNDRYEFWCAKCKRRPWVSATRWGQILDRLFHDRAVEFNVSYLD